VRPDRKATSSLTLGLCSALSGMPIPMVAWSPYARHHLLLSKPIVQKAPRHARGAQQLDPSHPLHAGGRDALANVTVVQLDISVQ